MGLETAPEGWAGGLLVNLNSDALGCKEFGATVITDDQYFREVNQPYSVERTVAAAMQRRPNSNPRDGAMLWEVRKQTISACKAAATPGSIIKIVSPLLGLPMDSRTGTSIYSH